MSEEGLTNTSHKKIFIGKPIFSDLNILRKKIEDLKEIIDKDNKKELIPKIEEIVPTYRQKSS